MRTASDRELTIRPSDCKQLPRTRHTFEFVFAELEGVAASAGRWGRGAAAELAIFYPAV